VQVIAVFFNGFYPKHSVGFLGTTQVSEPGLLKMQDFNGSNNASRTLSAYTQKWAIFYFTITKEKYTKFYHSFHARFYK